MQTGQLNSPSSPIHRWRPYQEIFKLTIRRLLWSRKTIIAFLVSMAPVGISVIVRISIIFRLMRLSARDLREFIPHLTMTFYLMFVTVLIALFFGTAIIADEVDNKTLTYLFTRPLRKARILLSKFAAYLVGTIALVAPSHLLATLIIATAPQIKESLLFHIGMSFKYMGVISLGLLAYGAIFATFGARFKQAVLWGLFVAFGWEKITLIVPGNIKKLSVIHYLLSVYPRHNLPNRLITELLGDSPPTFLWALVIIVLITAVFLYLSIWVFQRREYHTD